MKAILKKPGEAPEIIDIENELYALQKVVGGMLQEWPFAADASILCDEEGLARGLPYNTQIGRVHFLGNVLVVGTEGDYYTDLPQPEVSMELLWPTQEHKKRPTPARAGR